MSVNRQEYLDIISIVSHLARSDGDIADSEKKVLMTLFKAIGVTKEEQAAMKAKTSIGSLLEEIQSDEAKSALVDTLALVAGADGVFEDEERAFITKVMKRIGMEPSEHPYFQDGGDLDIKTVRANVKQILESLKSATA
ncbi:MAG: TerB family tellurite resistance protein [Deltaproteobacteria bacterium]|jgi:tellurite resistance protein|nr:TerB family tellurite resistance protein [Deltaproteobacteria bacterium]MBT7202552.1 TerB family tellurite resistance protein [Deltaproteobacteria bacterium]